MVLCCVVGCENRSDKTGCQKISFYRLPVVKHTGEDVLRSLMAKRYNLWLERINRESIQDSSRVCSAHFVTG
jgi:hypothetical protein